MPSSRQRCSRLATALRDRRRMDVARPADRRSVQDPGGIVLPDRRAGGVASDADSPYLFLELPLSRPERDVDPTPPASTCRSAPSRIGSASPPRRMFPGASTVATVSRPAMTGLRPSGTDPIWSRIGKTARAHRMLTLGRTPPIRIRAGPLRRRGSRRVAEGHPDPVLETGSEPGFGRRHRPRAPVLADRHEGEGRLGHLHGDLARPFAPPDLDLDA